LIWHEKRGTYLDNIRLIKAVHKLDEPFLIDPYSLLWEWWNVLIEFGVELQTLPIVTEA
jgi:hypothetical protein